MRKKRNIVCLALTLLLLSGCSMQTLDDLYQVPKRSEEFSNLQSAIDRNMGDMDYCAPLSGENLQTVQTADLDGDGIPEYLLFAKGTTEKPLQILIFRQENGEYLLSDTIQSHGSAFDQVEYARVDDKPGDELIVGCQISDQLTRSVAVYSFCDGKAVQMMNANYTKFLPCDMNADNRSELMVLRSGDTEEANGLSELYFFANGAMERSNQIRLSTASARLKRVSVGRLQGGQSAVFVTGSVEDSAIVSDVFAMIDGQLIKISQSVEPDNQTPINYDVYADDIDGDGVTELPALLTMRPPMNMHNSTMQYLIRWYALKDTGASTDKQYTFHNYMGGWYMTLDAAWAARVAVVQQGSAFEIYIWDEAFYAARKVMTVYSFTGTDRELQVAPADRFVLYRSDTVLYAAELSDACAEYGITQERVRESFHLIYQEWN